MGRPATTPGKLKDGFYLEICNKGSKSGIKIRRDNLQELEYAIEEYKRTKDVVVLGECINGKFPNAKKNAR